MTAFIIQVGGYKSLRRLKKYSEEIRYLRRGECFDIAQAVHRILEVKALDRDKSKKENFCLII